MLSTQDMGGVKVTEEQLREMQAGDYILHARGGKLEKVAVEKTRLPVDPEGHAHCLNLAQGPNGTIYASQCTIISKSTDGGRSWKHSHHRDPKTRPFRFGADGRMLRFGQGEGEVLPELWASAAVKMSRKVSRLPHMAHCAFGHGRFTTALLTDAPQEPKSGIAVSWRKL